MRASHVATALVAVTAGLTAAAVRQRRLQTEVRAARPAPAAVERAVPAEQPVEQPAAVEADGVVLPFLRTATVPPAPAAAPARCGDSGGLTKAGAPCAARATTAGRCHHHPLAARASA